MNIFLKENKLDEVYDWIRFQGWENLFSDDEQVDKELVVEFYKKISKIEKGPMMYLSVEFKGQELNVSSTDVAYELGLYMKASTYSQNVNGRRLLLMR